MSDARILERGYRRYDGDRRGMGGAVLSVIVESVRRMLGMKRGPWHKILPIFSALIAYVPAVVFVGLTVLLPDALIEDPSSATYADYYFFITTAILLFTVVVGPEVLCADRRTGMLGLYLASVLDRDRYLLAKAAAIAATLSLVTIGPVLLLLAGYTIEGFGPGGPLATLDLVARILLAGAAISVFYTAVTIAISSTTTKRAAASAAIALVVIGSSVAVSILVEIAEASSYLILLDLPRLAFEVARMIYGESPTDDHMIEVGSAPVLAAYTAWVVGLLGMARTLYHRLDVTR